MFIKQLILPLVCSFLYTEEGVPTFNHATLSHTTLNHRHIIKSIGHLITWTRQRQHFDSAFVYSLPLSYRCKLGMAQIGYGPILSHIPLSLWEPWSDNNG